jgi:hypothetical protein
LGADFEEEILRFTGTAAKGMNVCMCSGNVCRVFEVEGFEGLLIHMYGGL